MAGQGSARVTLNEIDLSQVRDQEQLPQGVPAAVVGPAKRGPAFVPKTFATMQQFNETFGNMLEQNRLSNANLYAPLALNEWMKNAQAGTFLRVLGVGDGQKATDNKVTNAGFKVGNKISHDSNNSLQENQDIFLTNADADGLEKAARTYMLGALMADMPDSRYLVDAGVQKETTRATLAKVFDLNSVADGAQAQLFLPSEIINNVATTKVSEDVTLTFKFVTTLTAQVSSLAKDTIEIELGSSDDDIADFLVSLLSEDQATTVTDYTETNKYQFKGFSN